MDLLVNKSYDQFSAIVSIIVLNGLNFEFSSFMNFLVNLRTNSVGYIASVPKLAPPEPPNRGGASHKKGAP